MDKVKQWANKYFELYMKLLLTFHVNKMLDMTHAHITFIHREREVEPSVAPGSGQCNKFKPAVVH